MGKTVSMESKKAMLEATELIELKRAIINNIYALQKQQLLTLNGIDIYSLIVRAISGYHEQLMDKETMKAYFNNLIDEFYKEDKDK